MRTLGTTLVGFALLAGTAASAQTTRSLTLNSQSGDHIGAGRLCHYDEANAAYSASSDGSLGTANDWPNAGSRVRLVAAAVSPRPLVGNIVSQDQTTLELQVADQKRPVVVPRDAITRMDVSHGRRSRGHGAGIGGLVGGATGAIAVLATPGSCEGFCVLSKGEAAGAAAVLGVSLGVLIGLAIPPGERWTALTTGPRVTAAPGHKGGVRVSLSFAF